MEERRESRGGGRKRKRIKKKGKKIKIFFSSRRRHTKSHCDWSSYVCSSDLNPMKLFIEPIQINLTFLGKEYDFKQYSMIGLSGGGWTTVVYSAIDDRISNSFSIASSIPFYLRVDERDIKIRRASCRERV